MAPRLGPGWRYASRSVVGTSHLRNDTPCQDHCAINDVDACGRSDAVIAVVADGAGSAARADRGAQQACHTFLEAAMRAVYRLCSAVEYLDDGFAPRTIEEIQEDLADLARDTEEPLSSFACTLLGAIVAEHAAIFVQIGDGAIVYRSRENGKPGPWLRALEPQRGEFANQTVFVTRSDAARRVTLARVEAEIVEFALMTDGVEHLAIRAADGAPHPAFFEHAFRGLRSAREHGRMAAHEDWLDAFLSSPAVCSRTDDDKTLVLCTRLPPA